MTRRFLSDRLWISALILACGASLAAADEKLLPGHSRHGAAFNECPRQDAYLMGGTGKISFPVTTKHPEARAYFEQGVGQLHGFWYGEAERSFRKVVALDPACGMGYWGLSLATYLEKKRSTGFAEEATKHAAGLTDRERMFIDAQFKQGSLQPLIEKYPNELEAKAFEVWRIWHATSTSKVANDDTEHALDLIDQILREEPNHPIHHAAIHFADALDREQAYLNSARRCGPSAPSVGHMWHMPTHIYYRLKDYTSSAWHLEASLRVENARLKRDQVLPDQLHFYAHNNEWLVRTWLNLGRKRDAERLCREMLSLPRHPRFNSLEPPDTSDLDANHLIEQHGSNASFGRARLLMTYRQYELWDELFDACKSGLIEPTGTPSDRGNVHFHLGIAHYTLGRTAEGDRELDAMRKIHAEGVAAANAQMQTALAAPNAKRREVEKAIDSRHGKPLRALSSLIRELEQYQRVASSFFVGMRTMVAGLIAIAVVEIVLFWFGRKRLGLTSLSLIPAAALAVFLCWQYSALCNIPYESPEVDFTYIARRQLDAGDPNIAEWTARQYAINRPSQFRTQGNFVEMLYHAGKLDEARDEFEKLRTIAGTADLDTPLMKRLAPIAREFGLPEDWRTPQPSATNLAERPPLESLGPLHWRSRSAPDWKLVDGQGASHSSSELRGKPHVLIFFLGAECLHCAQQLQAFGKKAEAFEKAGLKVVAISVDQPDGVRRSLDAYKPASYPFPILSDEDAKTFKAFRAYDDFEKMPLHGTFFVDADGMLRWFDVGFEPFMDADFVLSECVRLQKSPLPPAEPGAKSIAANR